MKTTHRIALAVLAFIVGYSGCKLGRHLAKEDESDQLIGPHTPQVCILYWDAIERALDQDPAYAEKVNAWIDDNHCESIEWKNTYKLEDVLP